MSPAKKLWYVTLNMIWLKTDEDKNEAEDESPQKT